MKKKTQHSRKSTFFANPGIVLETALNFVCRYAGTCTGVTVQHPAHLLRSQCLRSGQSSKLGLQSVLIVNINWSKQFPDFLINKIKYVTKNNN